MITLRASSLGACTKGTIAGLLGHKPIPPDELSLTRMSQGQLHEDDVVAILQAEGAIVTRQQEEVNIQITPGVLLQGHLDGVVTDELFTRPRVLEVKSMGKSAFAAFKSKGWDAGGLIDRYKFQISAYMIGTGLEALLIAKSRDSGELLRRGVELPFHSLDEITARCEVIEDFVTRGQLPDDCVNDWFCPWKYLCRAAIPAVDEDEPVNDPMMEAKLGDYLQEKAIAKMAEARATELKADIDAWLKLAGRSKARVGDYQVTWVTREIPESIRKASTQSFPQVKKVKE